MSSIDTPLINASVRGAYDTSIKLTGAPALPGELQEAKQSSFLDMVKEASQDAVSTVREADMAMQAGMRDEISIQQVVQATMAVESTLKTVVGIRDKMVAAYQEVLRMPI